MAVADSVMLGRNVKIHGSTKVNLYGSLGDVTRMGSFVEIQKTASVGARCKIPLHTFICEGVITEDEVFVGRGVVFINGRYPRLTNPDCSPDGETDWSVEATGAEGIASVGSNATVRSGDVGIAIRRGVMCRHREAVYAAPPPRLPLPNSKASREQFIILPLHLLMTTAEQKRVARALRKARVLQ
jgi:hypothetical protein